MSAPEKTVAVRGRRSRSAADARWQLPPLTMVRAFEATGRMGTMRKAADDISVSHTVISRHVRNLEAWIDRKLVITGPRGVLLTKEGELFFSTVSKAFQMIGNAALEVEVARPAADLENLVYAGAGNPVADTAVVDHRGDAAGHGNRASRHGSAFELCQCGR